MKTHKNQRFIENHRFSSVIGNSNFRHLVSRKFNEFSRTALISVSDKENIIDFAKQLSKLNIKIISTGKTAELLKKNKIDVIAGTGKVKAGKKVAVTDAGGKTTDYTAAKGVIIATGARSRNMPSLPQDG